MCELNLSQKCNVKLILEKSVTNSLPINKGRKPWDILSECMKNI